jgi:ABC-type antimicrobial peptide transport system permease subunit
MTFVLRSSKNPAALVPSVRQVLNDLDPNVPLLDAVTPMQLRDRLMNRERLLTGLLIFFSALALLLTCLGIYATLNYTVNRMISEIGLRMALGAQRGQVVRVVIRQSVAPIVSGIILGLVGIFILGPTIEALLFGVSPIDLWTLVGTLMCFLVAATIATLVPTLRATRFDPQKALRHE